MLSCTDDKTVLKPIPGNRVVNAFSRSRMRSSAAVRLLRVSGVREAFRLYMQARPSCTQELHSGRSFVHCDVYLDYNVLKIRKGKHTLNFFALHVSHLKESV
jgi:hypothetical protein